MDRFINPHPPGREPLVAIKLGWPERYRFLGRMEELMVCGICKEFYHAPVSAQCGHTFCSLCFRQALAAQQTTRKFCPLCHEAADEADLRRNLPLEAIKLEFLQGRKQLLDALDKLGPGSPRARSNSAVEIIEETSEAHASDRITCPVCNRADFSEVDINAHMDICLARSPPRSRLKVNPGSFKRSISCVDSAPGDSKGQMIYSVMNDKQLKKLLKDLGLNTAGDKVTLQRRHAHYLHLHNANCDATFPKPPCALRRELEAWERVHLERKGLAFPPPNPNVKDENFAAQHNILSVLPS
ncbi:E3 ubiquitin-protein ligase rad18 [Massospora cicadina]|nr:E3 ubiquitin-protein ligase rad18 [Massospora cicadina]